MNGTVREEVLKIRYSGLVYTRRVVLFESIDKWLYVGVIHQVMRT